MEHRKLVDQMKAAGLMTEQEVAQMLGCKQYGEMYKPLEKSGIKIVRIPMEGSTGRETRLYPRDEIEKYATENTTMFNKTVAGESNGGKLMKQIADLRGAVIDLQDDIDGLEARIANLEKRMNASA